MLTIPSHEPRALAQRDSSLFHIVRLKEFFSDAYQDNLTRPGISYGPGLARQLIPHHSVHCQVSASQTALQSAQFNAQIQCIVYTCTLCMHWMVVHLVLYYWHPFIFQRYHLFSTGTHYYNDNSQRIGYLSTHCFSLFLALCMHCPNVVPGWMINGSVEKTYFVIWLEPQPWIFFFFIGEWFIFCL